MHIYQFSCPRPFLAGFQYLETVTPLMIYAILITEYSYLKVKLWWQNNLRQLTCIYIDGGCWCFPNSSLSASRFSLVSLMTFCMFLICKQPQDYIISKCMHAHFCSHDHWSCCCCLLFTCIASVVVGCPGKPLERFVTGNMVSTMIHTFTQHRLTQVN